MSKIKTIIDTKNGELEVYFDGSHWLYSHNNQEVEEVYQKALMTRGLGNMSTSVEIPYNALLLSTITGTPKHFWYNCDEQTKEQIQTVLNELFAQSKPRLLEIRSKYLDTVKDKRMDALQEAKKRSRLN
jgi:hypothetical protein